MKCAYLFHILTLFENFTVICYRFRIPDVTVGAGGARNDDELFSLSKHFFPDNQKRSGGEGGRISAGNSTDKKGEGEELGGDTANKEKGNEHKDNSKRVVERPDHGFGNGPVDETNIGDAFIFVGKFADTVIDNDGIVDGEGKNGENGGDKEKVNFDTIKVAEKAETPKKNGRVVKHGNDGANAIFYLFEGKTNVKKQHHAGFR